MMVRHPEIQRKAQQEIDTEVGSERLPLIEDIGSLPYINNVLKEALRFASVIPVIPRSLDEDDVRFFFLISFATRN